MRVAVDATPLLLPSAGIKTYLFQWSRHLRATAGRNEVELFPFLGFPDECRHDRSAIGPFGTAIRLAGVFGINNRICRALGVPALNPLARHFDVFHASHQTLNPPRNMCVTATIHDLTCWHLPEFHTTANVRGHRIFAERVLKPAAGVIAVSQTARQDAVRILGLAPEQVTAIYNGVAPEFFEAVARPATGSARPYILFVGTIEPRKNIGALLDAYVGLPRAERSAFDLVIAGFPGWKSDAILTRLQNPPPGVRYLGYVPERRLPALTAAATIFVYPSLYEGFGLPVAQALAAGVPVITSDVSALPEITGDAAVHVNPKSAPELTQAMETLLGSPDQQRLLRERGLRRAAQFRWDVCARQSWEFFEKALRRYGRR